ncbi:MAG: hypothetical protein ACI4PS_06710 [Rhodocyclaceae bacterium]
MEIFYLFNLFNLFYLYNFANNSEIINIIIVESKTIIKLNLIPKIILQGM